MKREETGAENSLQNFADTLEPQKSMTVKMMSFRDGFLSFEKVKVIRIKGKTNLLIMCDYLPVLGEINGTLEFVTSTQLHRYENLNGYYCHSNNVFTFLENEEAIC